MDRRHEAAGDEAKQDTGREVVLPDAMAHLEILVEHGGEGERDWLLEPGGLDGLNLLKKGWMDGTTNLERDDRSRWSPRGWFG